MSLNKTTSCSSKFASGDVEKVNQRVTHGDDQVVISRHESNEIGSSKLVRKKYVILGIPKRLPAGRNRLAVKFSDELSSLHMP